MTAQNQLNLEELLERVGSHEVPGDTKHRYALRRALLRSRYFETNRATAKAMRIFGMTTSIVAGGAVIAVFVLAIRVSVPQINAGSAKVAKEAPSLMPPLEMVSIDESLAEMREIAEQHWEFAIAP